jgi:hypothetical protein
MKNKNILLFAIIAFAASLIEHNQVKELLGIIDNRLPY